MPHRPFVLLLAPGLLALSTAALAQAEACAHAPPAALTLAAAEARAASCNRDVVAAMLAVDAAGADLRIAQQGPNPTLTVGASNYSPSLGIGSGSLSEKTLDSSLRVEQVLERGGKPRWRREQADSLLAATRADLADQVRQSRGSVRVAWFDLAGAQARVALQREFVELSAESAAAAARRLQAGEVAAAEAARFRLDAARARNDLRQAEGDLERARAELARQLGAEAFAADLTVASSWTVPEGSAESAGERADVRAARLRLAAAQASLELARSLSTRDVTVGVQADHWPTSPTNLQGTGNTFGVSLSIPLQVRHANEGEAARAMAAVDAARAQLERSLAQAKAEAGTAETQWRLARERLQRVDAEVRPVAREVAQAAEFAYSKGATGVLDVLDARRALKSVELDALQARVDAAQAWARREAAREAPGSET